MSTATTEDRKSPKEKQLEGVPFSDIGNATELAPETPLTREAVIHLRAAGTEIDRNYAEVAALLRTVRNEVHPWTLGAGVTIDEERADDLSRLLRQAIKMAERRMVRPAFQRARGEKPHSDAPHLSLDEEAVWKLGDNLNRILYAAIMGMSRDVSEKEKFNCFNAIEMLSSRTYQALFERAGIPIGDEMYEKFEERVGGFGKAAAELGSAAVESQEELTS